MLSLRLPSYYTKNDNLRTLGNHERRTKEGRITFYSFFFNFRVRESLFVRRNDFGH